MPLIKGSSKKAFEHNIKAEMNAGKPQDQSLAIAYDMKRRSKKRKKMAEGGEVSASNEKRPMPEEHDNDSKMISQNSGKKPAKNDSWVDDITVKQAQRPSKTPLSEPRMVESNIIRTKLRDDERHMMDSMPPASDKEQPSRILDEEGPDRQGPEISDMEREHSNGRKAYAGGGMINNRVSMSQAEEDNDEHPAGLESDNDQMSPAKDEYMADHFAEGGIAHEMDEQPMDEAEEEHHNSIAAAIMAKKHRMMAEGGQVDLDENAMEEPNRYYARNKAILKENYDSDIHSASQPMDSNEHGDMREEDEENEHDRISQIRSRMNMKRQFR